MLFVTLAPMNQVEYDAFAEAQIADYADWLLQQGDGVMRTTARARAEIVGEMAAALHTGDLFWTASANDGRTAGWLWVRLSEPGLPSDAAFLYQIQVKGELRRHGFGRAMLAALEVELAGLGYRELRLNVWDTNTAARRLYEAAGYELLQLLAGKRQLRKQLSPSEAASPP